MSTPARAASTEVLLVRHGLPNIDRDADPGLSSVGQLQAKALAEQIASEAPDAIFSSHLRRTRETAAPLAELLGLTVEVDRDLREWETYVPQPFYRPPEALDGAPGRIAFLDGRFEEFLPPHDVEGLQSRMAAAVRAAAARHSGRTIVVVSHGGAINALLALVVGTGRSFFFDPAYTGVSRVRVMPDGRFVLMSVNETAHLAQIPLPPA